MNETKLCELVRQQENADRMFCLYPKEDGQGFFKVKAIAYSKSLTLRMDFFEEFDISVWVRGNDCVQMRYGREVKETNCFMVRAFARFLFEHNKALGGVFVYSIFGKMLRAIRAAADAARAARAARADAARADAARAAADAADDAAAASAAAADAADDAAAASAAADDAYAAYAAAADAYAAYAAAADAADAADAAAADAYAAYAAYAAAADAYAARAAAAAYDASAKKAFRKIIKWRKLYYK